MTFGSDRVRAFHRLHESGCIVIPNPWDVGSARLLAGMGFYALATTSSGFAGPGADRTMACRWRRLW
jgi:2-methylisocitrate lyase-like PEP mutase family enzyme